MNPLPLLALTGALGAQELPRAARILLFEVHPPLVKAGEPVELRWVTAGAEKVWLDPPGEDLPPHGRMIHRPVGPTVYWLFAGNGRGGQSVPAVVELLGQTAESPQGIWIQFAALADGDRARRLQEDLSRSLGDPVRLFPVAAPNRSGQSLQRIRVGPFPSRAAAQRRLREIRPKAQALHLKPMVMAE